MRSKVFEWQANPAWQLDEDGEAFLRVVAGKRLVAAVYGSDGTFDSMEADARLIAAAPELAAALRDVLDAIGALGGSWHELIGYGFTPERSQEICALLAKALKVGHD